MADLTAEELKAVEEHKRREAASKIRKEAESVLMRAEKLRRQIDGSRQKQQSILQNIERYNQRVVEQTHKLSQALFSSDRSIVKALKEEAQKAKDNGQEFTIKYQGVTFSAQELDPSKILRQRTMTQSERTAVEDVKRATEDLRDELNKLIATITREITYLNDLATQIEPRIDKLNDILAQARDEKTFSQAARQVSEAKTAFKDALKTAEDLRGLRTDVIRASKATDKILKVVSGVRSRKDLEDLLLMVGGAGALAAIVSAFLINPVVGGMIALPTLIAFGASRVLNMIRALRG